MRDINLRKVNIFEWVHFKIEHIGKGYTRIENVAFKHHVCAGFFHDWGVDYEEFETEPGNYSIAIVELPSGEVKSIQVDLIQFINK